MDTLLIVLRLLCYIELEKYAWLPWAHVPHSNTFLRV